jgi:hypothetical protein
MEDPVAIRKRIERLLRRVERRDDYGALLAGGSVVRKIEEVDDPKEWRATIRRHARADRIKVRTGQTEGIVWGLLPDAGNEARTKEFRRYNKVLELIAPCAVAHRHEPVVALRDGDEAVFACQRCDALGYADAAHGPLVGGALLEEDCPHEEPPAKTALTL